jgi:hypothetical protein
LRDYGVTKVTSAKNDWFYNPNVYGILVESPDGTTVYGGERIHIADGETPLPIESAVGIVDKKIYAIVKKEVPRRTGELCGLWNAKAVAGHGISILLTKLGVALAMKLELGSLFVLCAPYTVAMTQMCGFEIETAVGNKGTFYYPKLDLVATALYIKDVRHIPLSVPEVKGEIMKFISTPRSAKHEKGPKGDLDVEIDMTIPTIVRSNG